MVFQVTVVHSTSSADVPNELRTRVHSFAIDVIDRPRALLAARQREYDLAHPSLLFVPDYRIVRIDAQPR